MVAFNLKGIEYKDRNFKKKQTNNSIKLISENMTEY